MGTACSATNPSPWRRTSSVGPPVHHATVERKGEAHEADEDGRLAMQGHGAARVPTAEAPLRRIADALTHAARQRDAVLAARARGSRCEVVAEALTERRRVLTAVFDELMLTGGRSQRRAGRQTLEHASVRT
jgi:hypothetical protein